MPLIQQHAESLADHNLAARSTHGEFAPDQRDAGLRGQHVDTGSFHDFWD